MVSVEPAALAEERGHPVIVGDCDDPHVVAVREAAAAAGCQASVFDIATLESGGYAIQGSDFVIAADGGDIGSAPRHRAWLRRPVPAGWMDGVSVGSKAAARAGSWLELLDGVLDHPAFDWLTTPARAREAENKLLQLRVAAAVGLQVPRTFVTGGARYPDLHQLGDRVVVKPLGAGNFSEADGRQRVVYASEMSGADPLIRLRGAPFLVQQLLDADEHVRVVTVADRAWSSVLPASATGTLDWRAEEEAHRSWTLGTCEAAESAALAIASAMSVGYSSQDFVVAGGEVIFLDLNPAGQWLFLPQPTADAATRALAEWMCG